MEEIYKIIEITVIAFVLTDMLSFVGQIISEFAPKKKLLRILTLVVGYVLTCTKCSTFWLSLALTQNLLYAAITSLIVSTIKKVESKITKTTL